MVNAMRRRPSLCDGNFLRFFLLLSSLGASVAGATAFGQTSPQQAGPDSNFERCRAITDVAARLRCFESATSKPATKVTPQTLGLATGTWRLVRTRNPTGGKDAISIMQTADIAKSDLDLAGLMLRCGDTGVEVLLVLVRPLPPRAHPRVIATAAGKRTDFTATVVPPGAALLLPQEATELASGPWTAAAELAVQVEPGPSDGEPTAVRGVIPLTGLGGALPLLTANCPSP